MSNQNINRPPEYKNREKGRVLQDIFNPSEPTGYIYENGYNKVREAFESLRHESQSLFRSAVDHITKGTSIDGNQKERISKVLNASGVGLGDEVTTKVVTDWKKGEFSKSYQPKFMLDTGRPTSEKYYEKVAQKINNVRENNPQHGQHLDQLIKSDSSGKSLIYPANWYKEKVEKNEGAARQFANAVRGFSGLEIEAARAYVDRNPAQTLDM